MSVAVGNAVGVAVGAVVAVTVAVGGNWVGVGEPGSDGVAPSTGVAVAAPGVICWPAPPVASGVTCPG